MAAANGDFDRATASLTSSIELHAGMSQPFELARTHLVLGDVRRRAKQKRPARDALETAVRMFDDLGASLWAAKARRSLARISGRSAPHDLTATERQIAGLVVTGLTNREVADALFMSVRTVESNLSRIYSKLGIASRRELRSEMLEPEGSR
ncbi:MAG: response regulator transcription factor [Actinomycetota bacterium]